MNTRRLVSHGLTAKILLAILWFGLLALASVPKASAGPSSVAVAYQ